MADLKDSKYHLHLKGKVGGWDFSADMVDYILGKHKGQAVNVLIDSIGGYVVDAMSISSYFRLHGDVNVHYIGMNASAATIASMGAKHISMDADALYLVHRCSFMISEFDYCNAEKLESKIKELQGLKKNAEAIDLNVASMYARRCKKSQAQLLDLMAQERWLSASEALEWGFIDEITDDPDDKKGKPDKATLSAMAKAGLPAPPMDKSLFRQLTEWLFASAAEDKANDSDHNNDIIHHSMTDLKEINNILGVSDIPTADGKASLSSEQLDSIEKSIAGLKAEIASLQQRPADEGSAVLETSRRQHHAEDSFDSVASEARKMFNRIKR